MTEYVKTEDFETFKYNITKAIKAKWDRAQIRTKSLTTNLILKAHDRRVQFLNPGAASRDVTLPPEAGSVDIHFVIFNTGSGNNLVVKNDAGGTICTISQNEGGWCWCNGTDWKGFVGGIT